MPVQLAYQYSDLWESWDSCHPGWIPCRGEPVGHLGGPLGFPGGRLSNFSDIGT